MEDFIRVYDDAVSIDFCNNLIAHFDWCHENNRTWNRQDAEKISSLYKKDYATSLNPFGINDIIFNEHSMRNNLIGEFNDAFWNKCYANYMEEFSTLKDVARHTILFYKVQKTEPGGGYHVWHCEQGQIQTSTRIGVYLLYLNDVQSGGETEFLYQNRRVEARTGRLVIWPASYTHAHRGNPPLKGTKYIMTGWVEFA